MPKWPLQMVTNNNVLGFVAYVHYTLPLFIVLFGAAKGPSTCSRHRSAAARGR